MSILNPFLQERVVHVFKFLSELSVRRVVPITLQFTNSIVQRYNPSLNEEDKDSYEWKGVTYDDTDTIVLHRFFSKHADKVGKELLSFMKPSAEGDPSTINGKRAWDALCSALVDLGQPIEVPRLSAMSSLEHREYLDLVARYDRADVTAVRDIFVETGAGKVRIFLRIEFISYAASRTNQRGSYSLSRGSTWRHSILSYCFITSSRFGHQLAFFCNGCQFLQLFLYPDFVVIFCCRCTAIRNHLRLDIVLFLIPSSHAVAEVLY
jgi:hypothetical protein